MIRISNIDAPLTIKPSEYESLIARKTGIQNIRSCRVVKKSVDARRKSNIRFLFSFDVSVDGGEEDVLRRISYPYAALHAPEPPLDFPKTVLKNRPVVCGTGPAGMAAAFALAAAGTRPVILERGKPIAQRQADVRTFWEKSVLNAESNVQFGEGGAGAFSDGKLNTGNKRDVYIEKLLAMFVDCGAPEEIVYLAKAHVGTDNLAVVVKNWREKVAAMGGEYRFETKLSGLRVQNGRLVGVETLSSDGKRDEIAADRLILAIGHSARDTFAMLKNADVVMERKAFAAGVRIEHRQSLINKIQYGRETPPFPLGAADYKLVLHLASGRTAYSFCMCPGGVVVGAASEENSVVTNGMSYYARDGKNANSAFLINVTPDDFPSGDVLAGVEFQRQMERAAFIAGGKSYKAPAQRAEDFLKNRETKAFQSVAPSFPSGVQPCDLRACLPAFMHEALKDGLAQAGRKMRGFDCPDAVLTGVETRSSSPVRIVRDAATCESVSCAGLYPCGEGAGYAGGIVSAGADGFRCAEKILQNA